MEVDLLLFLERCVGRLPPLMDTTLTSIPATASHTSTHTSVVPCHRSHTLKCCSPSASFARSSSRLPPERLLTIIAVVASTSRITASRFTKWAVFTSNLSKM